MNVFIYANSYDGNSGGILVLHRLCHLINQLEGCRAWLVGATPLSTNRPDPKRIAAELKWYVYGKRRFQTNPLWQTPVWHNGKLPDDAVVVYPEVTNGNPLRAKRVVRWFLHQPGYHTGVIDYGKGELWFKFNSAIDDFSRADSVLSAHELKVIYYPLDIYQPVEGADDNRTLECCHMVRKGTDKPAVHPAGSVAVDGLSHQEMANVFRRARRFISYDDYTAYSIFAVLSGCESIVVPGKGRSITDWYPQESDRYGLAYGFEPQQLEWAAATRHKVSEHILAEHEKSRQNVIQAIDEIRHYFNQ